MCRNESTPYDKCENIWVNLGIIDFLALLHKCEIFFWLFLNNAVKHIIIDYQKKTYGKHRL